MIRLNHITSLGIALGHLFLGSCDSSKELSQTPNVIFILADNLGYGDIACFGSETHHTPHIDKLAAEGMRLTSFYSSSPVCTPSRASLMTGCYAQRVDLHLDEHGARILRPLSSKGLNPSEITIAELLSDKGFATACIGKWHLGDQHQFLPVNHGFDYFFGLPYSEDMTPRPNQDWPELPLLRNGDVVEAPAELTTTTSRYVDEAVTFMTENRNGPFFLYFSHNLPGSRAVPVVDKRFRGKSGNGAWGDAVEEIDWSVGKLVAAVEKLGIGKNTLIIFTSDNGAPGERVNSSGTGSNEPYSGPGYTTMEGGMRMPAVIWWPGTIPAGTLSDKLCTMMDWLPTLCFLARAKVPDDRVIDGRNIWKILSGDPGAVSPHSVFFYYHMDRLEAVRDSRWKLHLPGDSRFRPEKIRNMERPMLIDLENDPGEKYDVSNEYPEVVLRLLAETEKISAELGNNGNPGQGIRSAGWVVNPKPLLMHPVTEANDFN